MDKKFIRLIIDFVITYLVIILLFSVAVFILFSVESKNSLKILKSKQLGLISLQYNSISVNLKNIISDLNILSKQNELKDYFKNKNKNKNKNENDIKRLAKEFSDFACQRGIYDQIRFIDKNGMEIIRVDYINKKAFIIPKSKLQSKKHRYYFQELMNLDNKSIFISPLDLNMENKKVELPLKPMIRIAKTVYDEKNNLQGILILNYLASELLNSLKNLVLDADTQFYFLNDKKYFLVSPNKNDEWGFMFENRKSITIDKRFPGIWNEIIKNKTGQILNERGLFTYKVIYPQFIYKQTKLFPYNINIKENWIIVNFLEHKYIDNAFTLFKKRIIFLYIIYLISIIPAFVIVYLINKKRKLKDKLFHSAHYDLLTNLPNRILFQDRINQSLAYSKRYEQKFAILFLDLDDFKVVNDKYGHNAGDIVLIEISKRISQIIRESDTFARMGGDEFIIILNNIKDKESVVKVIDIIINNVSKPIKIDSDNEVIVGVSIGVSIYPDDGEYADKLVSVADDKMFKAKQNGKNNYYL